MRIRQLQLIRYGKFTNHLLDLPPAAQDIHLIVGPNEAGKSTTRCALSDWLFGFEVRTNKDFLHLKSELRLGGLLERDGQQLAFQRRKGNKDTLLHPDNSPLPDATLHPWLGDTQRPLFEKMFSLDHAALVEGGAGILSAKDDVGRMLFQSASGLEQLGPVLQGLNTEADSLWGPRKAERRLYSQAHTHWEAANAALKDATAKASGWKEQQTAKAHIRQQLAAVRATHSQAQQQRQQLERVRRVAPWLQSYDVAIQARQALGAVPTFPPQAEQLLARTDQALAVAHVQAQRYQTDAQEASSALASLRTDSACLALAAEITELEARRTQYRTHRSDIAKRTAEMDAHGLAVQAQAQGLDWDASSVQAVRECLPAPAVRADLAALVHDYPSLQQKYQSAQNQRQAKQQELTQAQAEQQALVASTDTSALEAALAQAQTLGDYAKQCQSLQSQINESQATLEAQLLALGPYALPLSALQGMLAPDTAELQALLLEQRADQTALKAVQHEHQEKQAELERLQLTLAQMESLLQPVSQQQVQAARHGRDAYWQRLCTPPLADDWAAQALHYQHLVTQADHLADTRLERIEHDAQYQLQAQRLDTLMLEVEQKAQRSDKIAQHLHDLHLQWKNLAQACGLPGGLPLAAAVGWLESRAQILASHHHLGRLQRQYQDYTQAGDAAHAALVGLLGLLSPQDNLTSSPPGHLAQAIAVARHTMSEAERLQGQRDSLRQQTQAARSALLHLQTECNQAEQQLQHWQQQWQALLVQAGYHPETTTATVRPALEVMDNISITLDKIDTIRIERIEAMQADLDSLALAAQSLCQRIAPERQNHATDDQVIHLHQRLTQAQQAQTQRQQWQQALTQARTGLQQAQDHQAQLQADLAGLYAQLNPEDPSTSDTDPAQKHQTLVRAIARASQAQQHQQEQAQAQAQLIAQGDGLSLAELSAEVAATALADIPAALQALQAQDQQGQEDIEALLKQDQQADAALAAFDGADHAAQAEAQRQDAITRMSDAAQRYVQVHTVARVLQWSVARFQQTQQGPMLARASQIFSCLTEGRFDRLMVDMEGGNHTTPHLYGHRPQGQLVGVEGLSKGTRDQLYLALRLAALDMQMQLGRALPFVADDLFINFDDQRTIAGLQALGELARKTQVIFLTHHEHLVPLAQQALGTELNIIRLQH